MTTNLSELLITYQPVSDLKNNPRNARTHTKHQVRKIANSITEFGFTNPVLLDHNNTIIAGHGRVAAAKELGLSQVPTIRLEDLTPDQVRAYVIVDNRLAETAGWDRAILAIELQHLMTIDSDFDVTITGFEIPEIDLLLATEDDKPDPDDTFQVAEAVQPVTQVGDLWHLGKHRVLCGNSVEPQSYLTLMGSRRANVVFCDPPFNTRVNGHVSGNGSVHHREFPMASGEMSEFEFISFLSSSLRLLARYSTTGSVHFLCMDWRHMSELLTAGKQVYDSLLNLCVWVKNSGGMGSFYRSQHELVFVFRNGKEQHRNNVQLGQYGRNRTNVWQYPGVNTFSKQTDEGNLLALHPTVKPVAMVADALLDCSARGEAVLDAFLGSGSTLIAAERTGRVCHGIELDPIYVDTAVKRWQRYTGDQAIHASTGKTFDEIVGKELEAQHG
jgi:16S rRNA G966 N2-methylase RsmD